MPKVTTDLLAFVIFALPLISSFLSAVAFEIFNYTFATNNYYILYIRILSHTMRLGETPIKMCISGYMQEGPSASLTFEE